MRTNLWRLLIVCIAALMLGGCGLFPAEEERLAPPLTTPRDVEYQTAIVTRVDHLDKKLPLTATFVSSVTRRLSYEFDGRFEEYLVMLNAEVDVGTVIAKLNLGDFSYQIEQADIAVRQRELSLESAETALENAKADNKKAAERASEAEGQLTRDLATLARQKIEQPPQDSAAARQAFDAVLQAERDAERALQLAIDTLSVKTREYERIHKKYIDLAYAMPDELEAAARADADAKMELEHAAAKRDDCTVGLRRAKEATVAAQQKYTSTMQKIQDGTYYDWVAEENKIRNVYRAAQDAADGAKRYVKTAEEVLARAELDLESAQNTRALLNEQNTKSELLSPIKGKISVLDPKLRKGDYVTPFQTIAEVVDPFALQIEVEAGSLNNVKAAMGMQGELTFKNQAYPCEIISTPLDWSNSKNMTEEDIMRANKYVFMADPMPSDAKQGDTGQIIIYLERRENVLVIPVQAVRRSSGRSYVLVKEGDKRIEVTITTGLEEGTRVEVIEGLEEGQEVILQ